MTDAARFVPNLIQWEGSVPTLYRDVLGYATTGIGQLVHDPFDSQALPWRRASGELATGPEVVADFNRVMAMPKGLSAAKYAIKAALRLSSEDVQGLAVRRLETEFLPAIRKLMPEFDAFPASAQDACVDIAWNVGARGLASFHTLIGECNARRWAGAAGACHRKTSRPERNEWAAGAFLAAAQSVV